MFTRKEIDRKTSCESEPAPRKKHRPTLAKKPKLALTSVILALASLPVVLAAPAQATTTNGVCSVTPQAPVVVGLDRTGHKRVDYRLSVTCLKGVVVYTQRQIWERDNGLFYPFDGDDYITSYNDYWYASDGGSKTMHFVHSLGKTDSNADEEPYQRVRFQVRLPIGGYLTDFTKWEVGPYRHIPY